MCCILDLNGTVFFAWFRIWWCALNSCNLEVCFNDVVFVYFMVGNVVVVDFVA